VNYNSPKEYPYNNKNQINKKPFNVKKQKTKNNTPKNEKKGVHKYFRNSIFRKRLFEIYDNLNHTNPVEELVKEGTLRACKEIIINRADYLSKKSTKINPDQIVEEVRLEFPYKKIPNHTGSARNFFVATVCNLTAEKISAYIKSK